MYIYNIFNTHFINYNLNNKIIGRYKSITQIQINRALAHIRFWFAIKLEIQISSVFIFLDASSNQLNSRKYVFNLLL